MTDHYEAGSTIAGEKILFCFGRVSRGKPSKKGRSSGTFTHHGFARVQVPLKAAETQEPRQRDKITCKSAAYDAKQIKVSKKKVTLGSHRAFEGLLKGDASCTITVPIRSQA